MIEVLSCAFSGSVATVVPGILASGSGVLPLLVLVLILYVVVRMKRNAKKIEREQERASYAKTTNPAPRYEPAPGLPGDGKAYFKELLGRRFPQYTLAENVPVQTLVGNTSDMFTLYVDRPNQVYRAEWGKPYDFVLYQDGQPKGIVMLGTGRVHQKQVKYLIAKMYAKKLGIPYIGFYTQFPNREDYVVDRIRKEIR